MSVATSRTKLLVAVTSCRRMVHRMEGVRATWGARSFPGVELRYFVGRGDAKVPDWVTEIDAPDDYASLPLKVHRIHEWIAGRDFDWIFKCDDDTYLVVERLVAELSLLRPTEFLGSAAFHPSFASGGAGYLVHRLQSNRLARQPPPAPGAEDVYFTRLLVELGYTFRKTPKLRPGSNAQDLPTRNNDVISCHWLNPVRMSQIHDAYLGKVRRPSAVYAAKHPYWQGTLRLFDDGYFIGGADAPDGAWSQRRDRLSLRWFSWPEDLLEKTRTGWSNGTLTLEGRRAVSLAARPAAGRFVRPPL